MTSVPADSQTIGEVMFRGNIVMKGYLQNPEATAEAFAHGCSTQEIWQSSIRMAI